MSGIAEVLHNLGYRLRVGPEGFRTTMKLKDMGIKVIWP
jgi:hypothetical protein